MPTRNRVDWTVDPGVYELFPRWDRGDAVACGRYRKVAYLVRGNGIGALCAYLAFEDGTTRTLLDAAGSDLPVHGGVTFDSRSIVEMMERGDYGWGWDEDDFADGVTVLGWDYMHAGDGLDPDRFDSSVSDSTKELFLKGLFYDGPAWTVEEVLQDVAHCVDWLYSATLNAAETR